MKTFSPTATAALSSVREQEQAGTKTFTVKASCGGTTASILAGSDSNPTGYMVLSEGPAGMTVAFTPKDDSALLFALMDVFLID